MSAPVTVPAFGTQLKKAGSAVALITEIDGPEPSNSSRSTVHLGSAWKTKRPTIPEGGELSFKCYMNATNYALLMADVAGGTIATWSIAFPNDDSGSPSTPAPSFSAYPSKVKVTGMEEDGTVMLDCTLTLTNDITP